MNPYFMLPSKLNVLSYPVGSDVRLEIQANSHVIDHATADKLLTWLCNTVIDLLVKPDEPLRLGKRRTSLIRNMRWFL